jgi:hypothetical protein
MRPSLRPEGGTTDDNTESTATDDARLFCGASTRLYTMNPLIPCLPLASTPPAYATKLAAVEDSYFQLGVSLRVVR